MSSRQPASNPLSESGTLLLRVVIVAEYNHVVLLMVGLFVTGLLDIMVPAVVVRILSLLISGLGIGSLILLGKAVEDRKCMLMLPYILWRVIVTGLLVAGECIHNPVLRRTVCSV